MKYIMNKLFYSHFGHKISCQFFSLNIYIEKGSPIPIKRPQT